MNKNKKELLKVKDLKKSFPVKKESFFGDKIYLKAVDGISFNIYKGETLGLVGESGCGKSTTGKMIVKLLEATSGSVEYKGKDILNMKEKVFKEYRKEIQMIFQDPYSSLDPKASIGKTIEEPLKNIKFKGNTKETTLKIMNEVGLREEFYNRYPHEFSGGQRQRVGVARSLILNPELIICDEPVSALDVSIQAQILNLMKEIQVKFNLTYLFIAHDLAVVKHISDRIAVMYLGRIVEITEKNELFDNPLHPYTRALLESIPVPNPKKKKKLGALEGDVPSPINLPVGCRFRGRCDKEMKICGEVDPQLKEVSEGHFVECHLY